MLVLTIRIINYLFFNETKYTTLGTISVNECNRKDCSSIIIIILILMSFRGVNNYCFCNKCL